MSGLLVKSTVVMRGTSGDDSAGLDVRSLGSAALTRRYVEEDCVKAYASGRVTMRATPSTSSP
jgi:5-methyltetrahydrofolate--homocysteine methyltransferase